MSLEVGYQRRWLVNFTATDSLTRGVDDHTQFGINVPTDARLPDGGGYVLGGLYNVTAAAAALGANNFVTEAGSLRRPDPDGQLDQHEGHRAAGDADCPCRPASTPRTRSSDYCEIRSQLPEWTVQMREPGQPLVQHVDRVRHAFHQLRVVHHPED